MIDAISPHIPVEGASTGLVWPSERLANAARRQGRAAANTVFAEDSYAISQEAAAAARGERGARAATEPLSYSGLFASSRAGGIAMPVVMPNGALWPAASDAGHKATAEAGPEPVEATDAFTAGKPGQTGGGPEARSSERAFLGGLAEGGGRDAAPSGREEGAFPQADASARLTEVEQREVDDLQARDREVRTHEQAHVGAGGGLVQGGASYETTTGPDGRTYAVGGEVQIDTSEASTPEATLAKAQRVKAAALAPAQPSGQDMQVAAKASQMEAEARQEKTAAAADEQRAEGTGAAEGAGAAKAEPGAEDAAYAGKAAARAAGAYARVSDIRAVSTLAHSFSIAV